MKRVLPKSPIPFSMDSPQREYYRNILKYQAAYISILSAELNKILPSLIDNSRDEMPEEMRTDSAQVHRFDANIEKSIRDLFNSVQNRLKKLYPDKVLRKWAEQMSSHVNEMQKKNISRAASVGDLEIEPLMKDGELSPFFKNVVDENVGLIRSIPKEKMEAFKNTLIYAITNDAHNNNFHEQLQKYISKNVGNTKARAKLIARDQVNKLNGKLSQYRQQKLGGKRYVWRTSEDERVRPDHARLDGTIQYWSKPPISDRRIGRRNHPGQDYSCRCHAEMVLEDVLE